MRAPRIRALGLCTGWGRGAAAIPADAAAAAAGRRLIGLGRAQDADPRLADARFRRATRECLWALAAVEAMLEDGRAGREAIAGDRTALVFVTAASYGVSNRAFIEGGGSGMHFAYTAPAVVPAEVAIEFGVSGPSLILIGGPPATLRAIWHAATLMEQGACDRALVLVVETFEECKFLYEQAWPHARRPLVDAAGCLWLEPGAGRLDLTSAPGRARDGARLKRRLGEMFACEPLAALGLDRLAGTPGPLTLSGRWRDDAAALCWEAETAVSGGERPPLLPHAPPPDLERGNTRARG
ncbi:MAG TPA: beta-ketoacyl synthase N-terminal-like domain-containing protein [Candidatus Limnocylindrales bacterium]|nr:beta-ketoacyl synthase N-terminal-like domain-containing protein [Candidatus Limnocylindrales bacterium]